jgi:uncharacterized OsmC-like protein
MHSLRSLLNKNFRNLFALQTFNFSRDVGNISHLKKFKASAHQNNEGEVRAFHGEEKSILITQPMETLLSCLSACELKSIMYWAKDNNVKIESLEINTDASYDSRNYSKNNEGKDITQSVEGKGEQSKQGQGQGKAQGSNTMSIKSKDKETEKYRNKNNVYEEVNLEVTIKTNEKDKERVMEILRKGHETCPVNNLLTQAGVNINTKFNIL